MLAVDKCLSNTRINNLTETTRLAKMFYSQDKNNLKCPVEQRTSNTCTNLDCKYFGSHLLTKIASIEKQSQFNTSIYLHLKYSLRDKDRIQSDKAIP